MNGKWEVGGSPVTNGNTYFQRGAVKCGSLGRYEIFNWLSVRLALLAQIASSSLSSPYVRLVVASRIYVYVQGGTRSLWEDLEAFATIDSIR